MAQSAPTFALISHDTETTHVTAALGLNQDSRGFALTSPTMGLRRAARVQRVDPDGSTWACIGATDEALERLQLAFDSLPPNEALHNTARRLGLPVVGGLLAGPMSSRSTDGVPMLWQLSADKLGVLPQPGRFEPWPMDFSLVTQIAVVRDERDEAAGAGVQRVVELAVWPVIVDALGRGLAFRGLSAPSQSIELRFLLVLSDPARLVRELELVQQVRARQHVTSFLAITHVNDVPGIATVILDTRFHLRAHDAR